MTGSVTTLARPTSSAEVSTLYDGKNLALIRRTVAKDTTEDEFNVFISMCRSLRLDPLRKQAYAFVFTTPARAAKGKYPARPEVRTLTLVTAIQGFRTIADRTGNYRPDEDAAELHFDENAKDAGCNPLGLVKAVVRVWKYSHGAWHRVTAEAYWDEYAPIKEQWSEDEQGNRRPTGKRTLDTSGQWGKMPRVMLPKCAEASALRKAFPDELSNVHEEAEIDRERFLDLTPSEAVAEDETNRRLERIGSREFNLTVDWLKGDMAPLELIGVGSFADRVMEFIKEHKDEPSQIALWQARNRHSLKEFWARSPGDALEVKKALELAAGVP